MLQGSSKFHIERVPSGTNIARLQLSSEATLDRLRDRLAAARIRLGGAKGSTQTMIMINETINRRPVEQVAHSFISAV